MLDYSDWKSPTGILRTLLAYPSLRRIILFVGLALVLNPADSEAIFNGVPLLSDEYRWAVVLDSTNHRKGQSYLCSGTVIAPSWVLTAGHCIHPDTPVTVRVMNVRRLIEEFGISQNYLLKNSRHRAEAYQILTDNEQQAWEAATEETRKGTETFSVAEGGHDIALVHLSSPFERVTEFPSLAPRSLFRTFPHSMRDSVFMSIGYGLNYVPEVGPVTRGLIPHYAYHVQKPGFHFFNEAIKRRLDPIVSLLGFRESLLLTSMNQDPAVPLPGDSGGPILVLHRGEKLIAGVISHHDIFLEAERAEEFHRGQVFPAAREMSDHTVFATRIHPYFCDLVREGNLDTDPELQAIVQEINCR